MMRWNQPHEHFKEEHPIQRTSNCKVLAIGMFTQKKASQHSDSRGGRVVEEEAKHVVWKPDYTWQGSNGRLGFCSKYNRKPVKDKQRSQIIFMMKTFIVSETQTLPGTELDED